MWISLYFKWWRNKTNSTNTSLCYIFSKLLSLQENRWDLAFNEVINSKDSSYRLLFDTLGNNQKIAFKIVGKYKSGIFSQSVLKEFNIKKTDFYNLVLKHFLKWS